MRGVTPFGLLVAAAMCCSIAALGLQVAPGAAVHAVAPARKGSAQVRGTSVGSYAIPTTVTEPTPTSTAPGALAAVTAPETPVVAAPTAPPAPAAETPTPTAAGVADPIAPLRAGVVAPTGPAVVEAKAAALFDLMNGARRSEGVAALERDAALDEVALVRARSLAINGYFDHYAPDGSSAFSEMAARGIRYRLAGENLARNNYPEARTVEAAFDGLMASPGHRANIMEERFSSVGVAAVQSGRLLVYVTVFTN